VSEGNACVMCCDAGKKGFDGGERSEDDRRVTCFASFSILGTEKLRRTRSPHAHSVK